MEIRLKNFGQFEDFMYSFHKTNTHPNGFGKTTLINAYVWVLSGRTINGFEPRKVDASSDDLTSVTLFLPQRENVGDVQVIRRVLTANGTIIYASCGVGDYHIKTQTELDETLNVPIRVACANTSILTEPSLTSEQLRKFLVITNVMNGDESTKLRKQQTKIRKDLKMAEQYALTNVTIPARTVDELTKVDADLIKRFEKATNVMIKHADSGICPRCNQPLPANVVEDNKRKCDEAKAFVDAWKDEYLRLIEQRVEYERETQAIEDAKRLIENAKSARAKVADLTAQLQNIDEQLRVIDANAINATLPDGVTVCTEKTAKTTGATSTTCTLLYKGVPLKSVNYAERVKIGVRLLGNALERAGLNNIPIIVDAAGEILDFNSYAYNLILFYAG